MVNETTAVRTFNNYINGRSVPSEAGTTLPNINPANKEEIVCKVQVSTPDDGVRAMEAAGRSPAPAWAGKIGSRALARNAIRSRLHAWRSVSVHEKSPAQPQPRGASEAHPKLLHLDDPESERAGRGLDFQLVPRPVIDE